MHTAVDQQVEVIEPKEELISPEGLLVANSYLQHWDVTKVAQELDLPTHIVSSQLKTREIKSYVDSVYMDLGYRNKHTLAKTLDTIIDMKMEEIEEAELGSNKDILEILALAHKFRMDELKLQLELDNKKQEANTINNVQVINEGSNYDKLLTALMTEDGS